jgi:flavin reductase (DIM6/NTAB) family NADH-FMN oxidoreductase RutF
MTAMTAIDPREFRTTLGRFASGVIVLTTVGDDGLVHGMTASGFVSVSLDPALVLASVDHRTRMHRLLGTAGRYAVSVLHEDQLEVAMHFAGKPQGVEPAFTWRGGMPVIDGALAHIVCDLHDRVPAGDHTLYLGRVTLLDNVEGNPLLFFSGSFNSLTTQGAIA